MKNIPYHERDFIPISTQSLVTGCITFIIFVTAFAWALFQIQSMKSADEAARSNNPKSEQRP